MAMGTEKINKAAKREDKGSPRTEVKIAKEKSKEKPRDSDMGFKHAKTASEHIKLAEHHHKEAKKHLAKIKK